MGHERLGLLPKTRKWNDLVREISMMDGDAVQSSAIAAHTLRNVRTRYSALIRDSTVFAALKFLVVFSYSFKHENPLSILESHNIILPEEPTLLSVVKAMRASVSSVESDSLEYQQLAISAAADALSDWHALHQTSQLTLLDSMGEQYDPWRNLGNGSGFCELARLYYSNLTEKYLNYFLERTASDTIPDIERRQLFRKDMECHFDAVSKHAFETSKITQSFAAGWFNKNIQVGMPEDSAIRKFIYKSFGKLQSELMIEEEG